MTNKIYEGILDEIYRTDRYGISHWHIYTTEL